MDSLASEMVELEVRAVALVDGSETVSLVYDGQPSLLLLLLAVSAELVRVALGSSVDEEAEPLMVSPSVVVVADEGVVEEEP